MSESLVTAYDELEAAHQRLFALVKSEYPVGAHIRWVRHRENAGVVLQHGYRGKLEVRNIITNATYWIRTDEIVAASRPDYRRSAA